MQFTEKDERRFWAKVALPDENGCMLWLRPVRPDGYASFYQASGGRRMWRAHRVAYFLAYGPIRDGAQIDHVKDRGCSNRHCMAPDHLEVVTQQENIRRGNAGLHQRIKTHCPAGHEYTPGNTGRGSQGQRSCRICTRAQSRAASARYRERRLAASQR